MLKLDPGTESIVFGLFPFGSFYVAYDHEILGETTGWSTNWAYEAVSSAAPQPLVQLPVVNHPEITVPRSIMEDTVWVKPDAKPTQVLHWFDEMQPYDYELFVPLPGLFLKKIVQPGDVVLRIKAKFQEINGSARVDPVPDVTIDVGQWLSNVVVAYASVALSGRQWVYRSVLLGAAKVVSSAKISCKWVFPRVQVFNTKFICDLELSGSYYRAFFDASLVPAPSLDLDGSGSDEDSCSDLSSVGSSLVMV